MKQLLITGGLGQVGSYLIDSLKDDYDITVLDNYSSTTKEDVDVKIIRADIRDDLTKILEDIDLVIHTAAHISVYRSLEEPLMDMDNNIRGTLNLLEACREADIERFVYFSSAAVYGDPAEIPVKEQHEQGPMSPYGCSKLAGEKYCMMYEKAYNLPCVAIRPFNIYSPRQDPSNPYSGVISKFIERVKNDQRPIIYGDGEQTRDFVSVHDIVRMVKICLEKKQCVGNVYNVGTGGPTSVNELAQIILELYNKPELGVEHVEAVAGDIRHSVADISRAREIGFKPVVTLEEGLREFVEDM